MLRIGVMATSAVLAALGLGIVMTLPLALVPRLAIACAWSALIVYECLRLWRGYQSVTCYELFPDGRIRLRGRDGRTSAARFAAGSVVLGRYAWLCVRTADGRQWAEPLSGSIRESEAWRRFQVICRHVSPC